MSFAYMPLYTGDYLRDTQHLSCSEHGIYLRFLMHCWDQKGPLPGDERKLHGICNARSSDEIAAMRRVLEEFFIRMEDGWYNRRMQNEVEKSENVSRARSDAGRQGYEARAKRLSSKSHALAKQVLSKSQASVSPQPQPHTNPSPTPSLETNVSMGDLRSPVRVVKASEIQEVLEAMNQLAGTNYPVKNPKGALTKAAELIKELFKAGYTVEQFEQVITHKYQNWQHATNKEGKSMLQFFRPETLFTKAHFEKYLADENE